jgi:hypothetical protein
MAAQIFTPAGGMNQDDSAITPTPNTAGRNAFELGDYKYALNARIGSSKSDNFGDLEIMKGTTEVTTYFTRSAIFSNSGFDGSLAGWSQIGGGESWIHWVDVVPPFTSAARFQMPLPSGTYTSKTIYQGTTVSGTIRIISNLRWGSLVHFFSNIDFYVVFFNSGVELSRVSLRSGNPGPLIVTQYIDVNVDVPLNCNQIGFEASLTDTIGGGFFDVVDFQATGFSSSSRPAGTEKVVGKLENKEFRKLYYCVWNSDGNHCVRYYDPAIGAVYELIKWSGLYFDEDGFVSMAMIDNFLAITDRINPPRLVDVETISDLYELLGSDFREYHISFHKWAPVMPPVLRAYYDGSVNNYKTFQHKTYQFSYRYIYSNKLKSRWSPISYSAQQFEAGGGAEITSIEIYIPGFTLDDPGAAVQYNYFNNNDIKFTSVVETIEIGYRESVQDIWRIVQRYEVQSSGNDVFRFIDSVNSTPIPTADFFQLFDTVPLLAGSVESIDNRFVFADCLDEKETAPVTQVTDVGVSTFDISQSVDAWWNFGNNDASDMASAYSGMTAAEAADIGLRVMINDATFKGRGKYKLGIQYISETGWRSAVYTIDNWIYNIPEETGIVDKMYALTFKFPTAFIPPEWAVAYQIMRTNCLNVDAFLFGAANEFIPLVDDPSITDDEKVPEDIRNRIRQHFEDARQVTGQDYGKYLTTLYHKPFFKSLASDVRETVAATALSDSSRIYISVSNWYNSSVKAVGPPVSNNPMNNLFYNYREGDRVRFLSSTDSTPSPSQKTVYDVPILEFTGLGIVIANPSGIAWIPDGGADTDPVDYIIEVYTPKISGQPGVPGSDNDYLYHESGEWYPVLYPGTEQRDFSKRDWTWTGNTSGVTCETYGDIRVFSKRPFSYGDCNGLLKSYYYDVKPDASVVTVQHTPSMTPDPIRAWDVWEKNNGRSAPAYTDLPVVKFKTTQVRFGGQVVEESFVNNINRFRDEDQHIYPSEYGRIRAIVNTANAQVESVGAILLCIGERETFSIYVNRTTLEDLSGRSQIALSDRILGSYNTLLGSHGTLNPESVSVERGRVYFWDAIDGVWVRYGRDGLTEISFYKMRNWFRELGMLLINEYSGIAPRVISGFDSYNEELIIFMDHSSLPETFREYATYKGAVFSEADTRWKSIHSYDPEMFAKLNNQLISFRGGGLYLHETNAVYSTFYGTKRDVYVEPVFNNLPRNMKSWQFLAITATHGWSVERFLSEYRGAKTKQQSSLTLSQFEEKEDGYYAAIKNDVNTPVVSNPIITGDKMRSRSIRALMKLDPSVVTLSLLYYATTGDADSPKNP